MPVITVDKAALQAGMPIEPNWYKAVVKGIEAKPSNAGDSINYITTFEITDGAMSGRQPKQKYFNSKGMGFMVDFIEAAVGEKVARDEDLQLNTDDLVGKNLWIKVENTTYEGRIQNEVANYAAIGTDPNALPF